MAANPWDTVLMSVNAAAKILRHPEITEKNMPSNWPEMRRLHRELWNQVYARN